MAEKSYYPDWLKWDEESIKQHNKLEKGYLYTYGIKDIQIKYKEFKSTSVYVSTPFTVDGNIMEVSLETDEYNPIKETSNRMINPYDTSVEYYISFKERPTYRDWIPILPQNKEFIENELLLFRDSPVCKLRFLCDTSKEIKVFKNGTRLNNQFWSYGADNTIRIDKGFDKYSIYTVQYYPNYSIDSPWNIELKESDREVVQFINEDGSEGELFKNGTDRNGCITLSKYPFIDYSLVNSTQNYQPIEVILENANIAAPNRKILTYIDSQTEPVKTKNVTDYKYLTRPVLKPYNATIDENGNIVNPYFEYYQDGRKLYFTETFNNSHIISNMSTNHGNAWIRVKYSYLRTKVRLKIVLRNTSIKNNAVTPIIKSYNLIFKVMR